MMMILQGRRRNLHAEIIPIWMIIGLIREEGSGKATRRSEPERLVTGSDTPEAPRVGDP